MKIEQIYTGCLAQGAYYIESEGEAVVIDPAARSRLPIWKKRRRTTPKSNTFLKHISTPTS
jgi:hydroxyacylglutathione hydrolase